MRTGRFIVVDGIAGSGKTSILDAASVWAKKCSHRIFDLRAWEEERKAPPLFEDVPNHDVYFTYEPKRVRIGAAIRHELSRTDLPYDGKTLAHAFAADRFIAYRRLIIPALEAGKIVIQDRSVSTSIVYQPIMPDGHSLEQLLTLPGNALAMQYPPDHLVITRLPPEMAVGRLGGRQEESRGVFAELEYLKRVQERFESDWFRDLFQTRGTSIRFLDTSVEKEQMIENAKTIIDHILTTC